MSDNTPNIRFNFNGKMENVGYIDQKEYLSLSDMVIDAPSIHQPENTYILAKGLNHFAHGRDFVVIEDIDEYTDNYRKTYAAEEDKPFDQYNSSISDFAMPELNQIVPPVVEGEQITFYVSHRGLGVPYRVTGARDGQSKLIYAPL